MPGLIAEAVTGMLMILAAAVLRGAGVDENATVLLALTGITWAVFARE